MLPDTKTSTWKLKAAALTERGHTREVNEDAVFHFSERTADGENIGLYLVSDGMGGHEFGDVASQLVVQTLATALDDLLDNEGDAVRIKRPISLPWVHSWLKTAVLSAHENIQEMVQKEHARKMGATVTAVFVFNNRAIIANVGDSRTYLWRKGHIKQITSDHSLTNQLVKSQAISAEEAHTHPMRNILTKCVGGDNALQSIDTFEERIVPGDKLLLCSDGLWHSFPEEADLEPYLAHAQNPGDLCWQLVSEANQQDGTDNISAVAVFITPKEPA